MSRRATARATSSLGSCIVGSVSARRGKSLQGASGRCQVLPLIAFPSYQNCGAPKWATLGQQHLRSGARKHARARTDAHTCRPCWCSICLQQLVHAGCNSPGRCEQLFLIGLGDGGGGGGGVRSLHSSSLCFFSSSFTLFSPGPLG